MQPVILEGRKTTKTITSNKLVAFDKRSNKMLILKSIHEIPTYTGNVVRGGSYLYL